MTIAKALALAAAFAVASGASAADRGAQDGKRTSIERGRYLMQAAGCNDCHTAGYMEHAGKIPEKERLKGGAIGWRGPWGTTYASNLRQYFARIPEEAFIADARSGRMRPPMPWFNLAAMTDADLRAMHRYVKSLGTAGEPAPNYVPPGEEPRTPYIVLEPLPPRSAQARAH